MNSALGPRIVSLWNMLELHATSFMAATTQLSRLHQIIQQSGGGYAEALLPDTILAVNPMIEAFESEASRIGAKLACIAAERLRERVNAVPAQVTWGGLGDALREIESRFGDHLIFVKLFVVPDGQSQLFEGAEQLLGEPTAAAYPSAWFDCEEAAKCLVFGRGTACVFHSMRLLEIGLKAFAKFLEIPDPVRATDRSWGSILSAIKTKIDRKYPAKERFPGTAGTFAESVYVSLDAIKGPWRNSTMHVENVYADDEAGYILGCSARLIQKMATGFDENGEPIQPSLAALEAPTETAAD